MAGGYEMHVAGMIEDGERLPEPSTLDAIVSRSRRTPMQWHSSRPCRNLRNASRVNIRPLGRVAAADRCAGHEPLGVSRAGRRRRLPEDDSAEPRPASAADARRGPGARRSAWPRTTPGGR